MRRVIVFACVLSLGHASAALAGETLLTSATRLAREVAQDMSLSATAPGRSFTAAQPGQPGLETSGMSKRKKTLIWLVAGVGFAAVAWTIDHKVIDVTPSSLGTRKD